MGTESKPTAHVLAIHKKANVTKLDQITKTSGIVITLCISPLFFLFLYIGDPGRGRAAVIGAGVIAVCARMFWDLRGRLSFWLVLVVAIICNAALVLLIPWGSNEYPGVVLVPIALPDFGLVYGAFILSEKLSSSSTQSPAV